ncbi:MAG: carboxypeptidase regulatory-like domain-containing protein [Gemmatimonadaceae bacterium]
MPIISKRTLSAALLFASVHALPASGQEKAKTLQARAAEEAKKREAAVRYGMIDGVVSDSLLHPLDVSDVTVIGTGARVTTSPAGKFRFMQVPSGQYLLVVRRIGYAPASGIVQVKAGDTLRLSYTLARSVAVMDTIRIRERRVSMRMREFETRRAQGLGQFLTQEEIEKRNSLQLMDYFRNMSGIIVSRQTQEAFGATIALSKREGGSFSTGSGACAMQILLDGIVLPRFFDLELLPPPHSIAGVEVYSGPATTPLQFGGPDRRCGVIAVWTRDGY